MKKIALIIGIKEQDDFSLTEFLLEKDYEVHGIKRRDFSFNTQRIDILKLQELGWKHAVDLDEGIEKVYEWYHFN